MTFTQILIVIVVVFIISIVLFIYFIRSKKVMRGNDNGVILSKKLMRNNNVFLDNFSEESKFQSLLRCHGASIRGILAGLTLIGIAIYIWWHLIS